MHLPMAPKKSLPKKGNPGLFASTIIRKSGCINMIWGEGDTPEFATNIQNSTITKVNS